MEVFIGLILILIFARSFGEIAVHLRLPSIMGEVVAGAILGAGLLAWPDAFYLITRATGTHAFGTIVEIAIFFLMFTAGLEVQLRNLLDNSRRGIAVAIGGIVIPLGFGLAVGAVFIPASEVWIIQAFFLGIAMAITAVPISVATLMDIMQLDSRPGSIIIDAAVVDDILGIVLLAVLVGMMSSGSLPSAIEIGVISAKVVGFFIIALILGFYGLTQIDKVIAKTKAPEMHVTVILAFGGILAIISDALDMHFMIGAFVAGVLVRDRMVLSTDINEESEKKLRGITLGFLAPVFFASTGLHIDVVAFKLALWFTVSLTVVGMAAKLIGCAIPARIMGLPFRESLAIGVGMSSRGGVELVVATVALHAGLFAAPKPIPPTVAAIYSAVIIMAIVSTIIGPIGLRLLLGHGGDAHEDVEEQAVQEVA